MDHPSDPFRRWLPWLVVAPLALVASLWAMPRLIHPAVHAEDEEKGDEKKPAVELTLADLATVTSEALPVTLQVNGTLEPLPDGRATVGAEVAGRLLDLNLKPGDIVGAGQVLARVLRMDLEAETQKAAAGVAEAQREVNALEAQLPLQSGTLAAQERSARSAVAEARAKLERIKAGSRPEEIERAQSQLAAAQADLERLKNGPRPQEINQAEAALREASAEVEVARKKSDRKSALADQGVVSAADRERAQADLTQALAKEAGAREALAVLRQGTRPEEIRAGEAKARDAEAALRLLKKGPRPEEVREAEAQLAQADAKVAEVEAGRRQADITRAEIEAARQRLRAAQAAVRTAQSLERQTVIRAPIGGTVSKVIATRGEVVQPGAPIAELQNGDALRVLLQVPAAHQSQLRPGLPVTISLPHAPQVKQAGTIRTVNPVVDPATGTVSAEVWVPNRGGQLRPGTVVTAEIRLRSGATRPVILAGAVFSLSGEQYVYRLDDDGEIHETRVTLGSERGETVQVLNGLHPGDRILRDGRRSIADGSPFKGVPGEKADAGEKKESDKGEAGEKKEDEKKEGEKREGEKKGGKAAEKDD
jgi:RND family efflux transporter MFP subunit